MGCSILTHRHSGTLTSIQDVLSPTQMRSFSWSHHSESHLITIMTQWQSCALNGCPGALPTHSLVFMALNGCSGGVQYSLIGIHVYSQAFRVVQYSLKRIQPVQTLEGPIDMFSNMLNTLMPYKLVSISSECLFFGFTKKASSASPNTGIYDWYVVLVSAHETGNNK